MTATAEILTSEEQERQQIEAAYEGLVAAIKTALDDTDRASIRAAFELAVEAHAPQRRKTGEPYILHPIAVARICAEEIGLGPTAIVAALLHDVVEDTPVTLQDIQDKFNFHIAKMVDGLTKLDSAYNSESPQAENFKKVLSTLVEDVRIVLIKMADRLHNMRTLGAMPPHKQLKIAAETSYIYAPLAHRLGLYAFRTEFLDLCMKITDPTDYFDIARKLQDTKREREAYIASFIEPLKEQIDELGISYRIFGRPKSIYSIWNKLKNKQVPFEEIYDLFAIRIIVDVPPKKEKLFCWQIYSIVTDVHRPITERLKDWITTPKANGYESLHTTVVGPGGRFVEVQIRSERMDEIAERGFAAHWKYKGITNSDDVFERWLDSVREILEDPEGNPVEFLDSFRSNSLFNEEVYVYTPKGDLRVLPKGATALDFAFNIHSDVGYHCTAIKIDNQIVPMGRLLKNGDRVEIITNNSQKPSEDWMKLVTTGKAKAKIRSAMKEERRQKGQIGREALERKFKNMRIQPQEEAVDVLVKHFRLSSHVDLYYGIAMNIISIPDIFKKFSVEQGKLKLIEHKQPEVKKEEPVKRPRVHTASTPQLLINGEPGEQYDYTLATCCNPVPGDSIFAYLTASAGLKIHRVNCPNAANLMVNYGYRIMNAEWASDLPQTNFVAKIGITGIDDGPGVIERLTHQISQMGLNIRSMNIAGTEGFFEAQLSLVIANTDQLNLVIRALKNISNVSTVTRID
ncbi:MAG: RelA/SpoT family protein [Saprospiraceae bacterium]